MDNIHNIMAFVYTLAYKYYVWLPYAVLLILLLLKFGQYTKRVFNPKKLDYKKLR